MFDSNPSATLAPLRQRLTAVARAASLVAFVRRAAKDETWRARALVCAVFVALFAAHVGLLRPVLQNGDSAVYNDQIESRFLGVRTTHLGYMALGVVFDFLLPFGTELNMNIMVLVLGFVGVASVYVCARQFSGSRVAALASSLLVLLLPSQLYGMLLSEVDVVSAALTAAAYACFVRGQFLAAGLVFGYSVLVTPLSGPLLIVFVLTIAIEPGFLAQSLLRHLRRMLVFGAAACLVYVPPVLVYLQDYVDGPRGLLHGPRGIAHWADRVQHSFEVIGDELGWLLPIYLLGLIASLLSARLWRLGQAAIALLASTALMSVVGDRFTNVPAQLPNLVLLASLPAVAFVTGRWAMRIGILLELGLGLFVARGNYGRTIRAIELREHERNVCLGIREQSRPFAPVLVGVRSWARQRAFERYASGGSPPLRAAALDAAEFARSNRRWLETEPRSQFWFFKGPTARSIEPLRRDYSLESRTVGGRRFPVLVPTAK